MQIFLAAITVVHMEPQWPVSVPYVYSGYPAYPVRVVPRINPVASSLAYSISGIRTKNLGLSAEECAAVNALFSPMSKGSDFKKW